MLESLVEIISNTILSVVHIHCRDLQQRGTGFLISREGHVVTNNHVISRSSFSHDGGIQIVFSNDIQVDFEGKWYRASLFLSENNDKATIFDYAVLKLDITDTHFLRIMRFEDVKLGQAVAAIGFPHDFNHAVVTNGIVSCKEKVSSHVNSLHQVKTIITNARISQGNSGGPLISADTGEVLGINTLVHSIPDSCIANLKTYISLPGITINPVIRDLLLATLKYTNIGLFHAISMDHILDDTEITEITTIPMEVRNACDS